MKIRKAPSMILPMIVLQAAVFACSERVLPQTREERISLEEMEHIWMP